MSPNTFNRRVWLAGLGATLLNPTLGRSQAPHHKSPRFVDGRREVGAVVQPKSSAVVDGETHEGVEIAVALPAKQHVKNFGAPKDNKGLCVFASMTMQARWHNIRALSNVIKKIETGGGWPEKVDETFKQYSPSTKYVQYEGTSPALLDKAIAVGSPVCVTYGYGERYKSNGQMETIYHMVLLVHLDADWAVILDNNFPGTYEWMPRAEFLRRWVHPSGKGWAFVMLAPPAPPVPHN